MLSVSLTVLLLQSVFCFVLSPVGASAQTQETLTNQSVVDMVKSGFSEEIIIAKIKSSRNSFDTSASALQTLKKSGASNGVMMAMMQGSSNTGGQANSGSTSGNSNLSGSPMAFALEDQTPIKLRLSRNMSSADAKTGETVDFEVIEDVKVGDIVVVQRGAVALATVTNAKPKGRMGKGGKLDIVLDSVRLVSGEKVALRASKETKGGGKTGAMTGAIVASSILFFPAAPFFLLMKGKDIAIPKGTEVTAYVNGTVSLDARKFNSR
ncbi:MAG: hypothetical protein M3525_13010 [Acidobacteriota bacterium]|nr:hypothetical protein [Acidobacteriota bacterium]